MENTISFLHIDDFNMFLNLEVFNSEDVRLAALDVCFIPLHTSLCWGCNDNSARRLYYFFQGNFFIVNTAHVECRLNSVRKIEESV